MKKLMLFAFVMILLISSVSALGFDNKLTYEKNDLKVVIDNLWNLPIIGERLGSAELKSHSTVDEIRSVSSGQNVPVMYYDFNFTKEYVNGLGKPTFTNKNSGKDENKNYYFAKAIYREEMSGRWINCKDIDTASGCEYIETGLFKNFIRWEKIENNSIPSGEVRIALITSTKEGDYYDGIWRIAGKKISKHAHWTVSSLLSGFIDGYPLNQTTGSVIDSVTGDNDGNTTNMEDADWIPGVNNNSLNFDGTDEFGSLTPMPGWKGNDTLTISFWLNTTSTADFALVAVGGTNRFQLKSEFGTADGRFLVSFADAGGVLTGRFTNTTVNDGIPHLITISARQSGDLIVAMIDGINYSISYVTQTSPTATNLDTFLGLCNEALGEICPDGVNIDEIYFWGRSLNQTEVLDMFDTRGGFTNNFGGGDTPPVVTTTNPINNSNITVNSITFAGTANDNINLVNVSLYLNGIINQTNSTPVNASQTNFTLTLSDGIFDWFYSAWDNATVPQQTNSSGFRFTIDTSPVINVFSPTNTTFTSSVIFFNATSSQAEDLWVINYNGTNITKAAINISLNVEDGFHHLLLYANNSITGKFGLNDTIFFTVDTQAPNVFATAPNQTFDFHSGTTEILNWTATDASLDTCFFEYNNVNTTVTCNLNTTTFTITDQRNLTFWANDTLGNLNSSSVSWSYLIFQRAVSFNSSSFETAREPFLINVTTNGSTISAGTLVFNSVGTTGSTITNTAGNNFTIVRFISIPVGIGTLNHFFNLTAAGRVVSTITNTQLINATNFTLCGVAPQNIEYINISFRNETLAEENITATIDSTWTFSLSALSGVNKTLIFTNASENPSYTFCSTPGDRNLNIDMTMNYNNDISQQRSFALTRQLSSVVTNQLLYLLPTTLGLFSQFVTVDTLGRVIPSVKAGVTRILGGNTITIGSGFTDGSGFISFFTNPDALYTGTFEKTGFTTEIFTFTPITDLRTVTMAASSLTVTNGTTITLNTTYIITPTNTTLLNNTNVTFGFNVTSEQDIIFISLNITNSTGHQLGFVSSTGAGFISTIVNTSENTKLFGTFILNTTTESLIIQKVWIVGNFFTGDYSIFRQLTLYNTYGFKDFFRLAMVLFVIFGTLIFMTRKEITDTAESKIMIVTLLIWAFSIVGWLDSGFIVNNASSSISPITQSANQYGVAILITMGGAIFFLGRRIFIRRP